MERFPVVYGTSSKLKVLHQKRLVLMPTRTFFGTYGIELLWWHSVTKGLEESHGVRAYGYTKKWEDFILCTGTTDKIKVLYQKPLVLMPIRTFPGVHTVPNYYGDIP